MNPLSSRRERRAEHEAAIYRDGFRAGLRKGRRKPRPRDAYRYVFVVAYGRSGSTLVQGLLNVMPRTLVRGENNFYLLELFHALEAVREFRRIHLHHETRKVTSAFYGLHAFRPRPFVQAANDVVTWSVVGDLRARDYDVLGFKEVLWHRITPEETELFFEFMDLAFPGVGYVLNTRDPATTVGSGFWTGLPREEALAAISRVREIQDHLRVTRPDRVVEVEYETLTGGDPEQVDGLLERLAEFTTGRPATPELMAGLRGALSVGHGPNPFGQRRADTLPPERAKPE